MSERQSTLTSGGAVRRTKARSHAKAEGDIVFAMVVSAYPLIVMYNCDVQCVVGGPPREEQTEATNRMLCTGFIPIIISLSPRTP